MHRERTEHARRLDTGHACVYLAAPLPFYPAVSPSRPFLLSNLTLRILTGVIGAPVLIGLTYLGGWPFAIAVAACGLVAQDELYRMLRAGGAEPDRLAGFVIGGLIALRLFIPYAVPVALILALLLIAFNPFFRQKPHPLTSLPATFFGVLYPTFFFSFLIDLREANALPYENLESFFLALSVFLLIWATDTFAYFTGKSIGKRPLAPSVSPKKTWEGSVGGAVGAVLVAVVLKLTLLDFVQWHNVIVIALICGVFSQLGDLAESKMKRSVGVKDSGTILPGHGGVLDRFDALILAVPIVYLYLIMATRSVAP